MISSNPPSSYFLDILLLRKCSLPPAAGKPHSRHGQLAWIFVSISGRLDAKMDGRDLIELILGCSGAKNQGFDML
jgi:hypothetical protein